MRTFSAWLQQLTRPNSINPQLISYQALRKSIGWLGVWLPFALVATAWLMDGCTTLQPSISHYYFTAVRDVFVGTLCAVALFLFSYKGYADIDRYVTNLAGFFCLGSALFPTAPVCTPFTSFSVENLCYPCQQATPSFVSFAYQPALHFWFAGLFFFTLAMMSIFLFRLSNQPKSQRTRRKHQRNTLYLVCGIVMLASVAGAALYLMANDEPGTTVVWWLETIALVAFGVSWLTKGEMILEDESPDKQNGPVNRFS